MNAHTKQQQDKVFETDFIDSQKSDPPFAHLLALSHIIYVVLDYCSLDALDSNDTSCLSLVLNLKGGPL